MLTIGTFSSLVITTIADLIKQGILSISAANADKEGKFVQQTLDKLLQQFPKKNVVIFHDQRSKTSLQGGDHKHYELSLELTWTKGYEIWVFDQGWFELGGDGGWRNVGYGGCWKGSNAHVDFCKR